MAEWLRVAGIKASLFEPDILADYLLYRLNLRSMDPSYRTSTSRITSF